MSGAARKDVVDRPAAGGRTPAQAPASRVPYRPRLWPLLPMLTVQGAFLALIVWLTSGRDPAIKVSALDAVALPDQVCELGVRLERPGARNPDLTGVNVFLRPLTSPAAAEAAGDLVSTTDASGLARVSVKAPAAPGAYHYVARLEAPSHLSLPVRELGVLLQVSPREGGLVLVPVPDALMAEEATDVRPGAKEAIRALGAAKTVVFVSRRVVDSPARVRAWLEALGLPVGPVLLPRGVAGAGLLPALEALRLEQWQGPHWAVATSHDDAHALATTSATVLLIKPDLTAAAPNPVVHEVKDWTEAQQRILGRS